MARDILFKAKRKNHVNLPTDEWWVEGYLVKYGWTGKERWHIVPSFATALYAIEIDQETICQYTGLTDKNGNKIWENDIVTEDWRNTKGVVRFGEFEAQLLKNIGFNIEWTNNISYRQDLCWWAGKCEVIGNIFDNPELMNN